jgi:tetratricopeptide (TPR) repeat protein
MPRGPSRPILVPLLSYLSPGAEALVPLDELGTPAPRQSNLALLLRDTNRLAEAEPLFRRALAIDEKSFGPEHPNVANMPQHLALLLRATNRLTEAEPLSRRQLEILLQFTRVGSHRTNALYLGMAAKH